MSAPRSDDMRRPLAREAGATLALAWPLILANLAVTVMTTTDYVMLGLLSPQALAAGALGFNLYQPTLLLGIGVVAAVSPIGAAKIGAGEGDEVVRRASHQAFLSALAISAVSWALLSRTTAILTAIGEPPELAEAAGRYMRTFQWGLAPSLLFVAGRAALAAFERPRAPLIAGLVAVVFNAAANDALIFGKFGLPALGVAGSGLATTLSQTLMFGLLVAFSLIDPRLRRLRLFALPWRPAGRELAALWRLGLPIAVMIAAEVGVFASSTLAMGLLGPATLEAHTIALQIASLAFMIPLGLGQAASVRIGRGYGARDRDAIARAGVVAFGLTLVFALVSATIMVAAPRLLISLFLTVGANENAAAVGIAVALLRIAAIFQVFDASQVVLANMLRGLHDSRWPLVIALVGYWAVGAPVGVALGFFTPLAGEGVWTGLAAGLAVVAVLLGVRWLGKARIGYLAPRPAQGATTAVIGEPGSESPAITS